MQPPETLPMKISLTALPVMY